MSWWVLGLMGCGSLEPASERPDEVRCDGEVIPTVTPAEEPAEHRWVEGTEVTVCRVEDQPHGKQVERYPGEAESPGAVAAIGQWVQGMRAKTWTRWNADGVFEERVQYSDGQRQGPWQLRTEDGNVVEMVITNGELQALRALPKQAPLPKWNDTGLYERSEGDEAVNAGVSTDGSAEVPAEVPEPPPQ